MNVPAALILALVWVLAYEVGGWVGVWWMAMFGFAGECVLLVADEVRRRRHSRIVRARWDKW